MLVVTRKTLHAFIVKNIQPQIPTPQTAAEPPKPIVHQNNTRTETGEVPTEQEKTKLKKGIKKFDWKNATTDGLI